MERTRNQKLLRGGQVLFVGLLLFGVAVRLSTDGVSTASLVDGVALGSTVILGVATIVVFMGLSYWVVHTVATQLT